jgi:crotonobetainyl-CoA:carnitine CoA-transferase CaiB-like acyl-CoA transferase
LDHLNTEAVLSSALAGTVILECGDERGEFAGVLLAALGAEVIKLEGRTGSASRRLGPFTTPERGPEHSLCFSRYNLGKKSVSLEIDHPAARDALTSLAARADVIIDSGEAAAIDRRLSIYRKSRKQIRGS